MLDLPHQYSKDFCDGIQILQCRSKDTCNIHLNVIAFFRIFSQRGAGSFQSRLATMTQSCYAAADLHIQASIFKTFRTVLSNLLSSIQLSEAFLRHPKSFKRFSEKSTIFEKMTKIFASCWTFRGSGSKIFVTESRYCSADPKPHATAKYP